MHNTLAKPVWFLRFEVIEGPVKGLSHLWSPTNPDLLDILTLHLLELIGKERFIPVIKSLTLGEPNPQLKAWIFLSFKVFINCFEEIQGNRLLLVLRNV